MDIGSPATGRSGVPAGTPRGLPTLRFLTRDAVLVTLIAIATVLSAFAVYEATRAGDDARDLYTQSRLLDDEFSSQSTHLHTLVDSDLDLLGEICAEELAAAAEWPMIFSFDADVSTVTASSMTTTSLRRLLQGDPDATCDPESGYSIQSAIQNVRDLSRGTAPPQTAAVELRAVAAERDGTETALMSAALLFALVVGVLVVLDATGGHRRAQGRVDGDRDGARAILTWCWPVPFVVGAVLLAVYSPDRVVAWTLLLVTAGIIGVGIARRRPEPAFDAGTASDAEWPRWVAEIVGPATIVVFAIGALGLSALGVQERDATDRADFAAAVAQDLQQVARHESMREIAAIGLVTRLEAQEASERQPAVSTEQDRVPEISDVAQARIDDLSQRLLQIERDARRDTEGIVGAEEDSACPLVPGADSVGATSLLDSVAENPGVLAWRAWDYQDPSRVCAAVAALNRTEADRWAGFASSFTVALVLLGLAGFLLALAADSDRSVLTSSALLVIGTVGLISGIATMAPAVFAKASTPSQASVAAFAKDLVVDYDAPCDSVDRLTAGLASFPDFGPAYQARADAIAACGAPVVLPGLETLTSDYPDDVADAILADVEQAAQHGPTTPLLDGNVGWWRILRGIQHDDPSSLVSGLDATVAVREQLEAADDSIGTLLHIVRFNEALALLTLGREEEAEAAYTHAVACVTGAVPCPGGPVVATENAGRIRAGALADLELLPPADELDDVRRIVLGIADEPSGAAPADFQLSVYSQELMVSTDEAPPDATRIVWYARADDDSTWQIVVAPTLKTMADGAPIGVPFSTAASTGDWQYRAAVFTGADVAWAYASKGDSGDLERRIAHLVGLSAAVPADWTETEEDGLEWHVGPNFDDGITVRRIEGVAGYTDIEANLDEWADSFQPDAATEPVDGAWLLGAPLTTAHWRDDVLYVAGLVPFGTDTSCGGTVVQLRVGGEGIDRDLAQRVHFSLVMERPATRLPAGDGTLELDGLSLDLPSGWDAAVGLPGGIHPYVSAGSCTMAAYLDIQKDDASEDEFGTFVQQRFDSLENRGYTIEDTWIEVFPGSVDGQIFVIRKGEGDSTIRGWEAVARAEGSDWTLDLYDFGGDDGTYAEMEEALESIEFVPSSENPRLRDD